jgi:hypothetical protein
MTTQTPSLPTGPYQATLIARRTLPVFGNAAARVSPGVEMTVRISGGQYTGREVPFRVYGAARVQRARMLTQGQLLLIHVGQHRLDDGRVVTRVADFEPTGTATTVDLLRGFGRHEPDVHPAIASQEEAWGSPPDELLGRLRAALTNSDSEQHVRLAHEAGPTLLSAGEANYDAIGEEYQFGFIANRKRANRTFIHFEEAFNRFAAADEQVLASNEGYLSLYQYSANLAAYRDKAKDGSLAGYRGVTWARWLAIDLDGDGSPEGLAQTFDDARKAVAALVSLGLPRSHVLVFFSGNRGIHVLFPATAFAAIPRTGFEEVAGITCGMIASLTGITIDKSLYTPLKPLRAHNTRHDVTGLYKVLLGHDELEPVTSETIRELARTPRPFEVPDWRVPTVRLLADLWQWAGRAADIPCNPAAVGSRPSIPSADEPKLFADTLDLIVHGAAEGTRATRFFRACMNLLDFDCPEDLLFALLEPAARLSNFPDHEFMSQIQGATKAHSLTRMNKSF